MFLDLIHNYGYMTQNHISIDLSYSMVEPEFEKKNTLKINNEFFKDIFQST